MKFSSTVGGSPFFEERPQPLHGPGVSRSGAGVALGRDSIPVFLGPGFQPNGMAFPNELLPNIQGQMNCFFCLDKKRLDKRKTIGGGAGYPRTARGGPAPKIERFLL